MSLIGLIVFIVIIGLLAWGVSQLPIDDVFKRIIYVIAVLAIAYYIMNAMGLLSYVHDIRIGR